MRQPLSIRLINIAAIAALVVAIAAGWHFGVFAPLMPYRPANSIMVIALPLQRHMGFRRPKDRACSRTFRGRCSRDDRRSGDRNSPCGQGISAYLFRLRIPRLSKEADVAARRFHRELVPIGETADGRLALPGVVQVLSRGAERALREGRSTELTGQHGTAAVPVAAWWAAWIKRYSRMPRKNRWRKWGRS